MGATKRNGGHQKGAQHHAEGEHGNKTTNRLRQAWNNVLPSDDTPGPQYDIAHTAAHDTPGKDRLFDARTQHDAADLNSEQTPLVRNAERHKHVAPHELDRRGARASAKRKS